MKLSARSYPHPVLGNRDDIPGFAFQATIEMSTDAENVYLELTINCSSRTINEMVACREAEFVAHVECSNTFLRRAFTFSEYTHRISIPADDISDNIEVNCIVRTTKDISGYSPEGAHPDYAGAKFELSKGDILAVAKGMAFVIESRFDSLKPIGSIIHIEESKQEGDIPMDIDPNGDKIVVLLSKSDFREYKSVRSNDSIVATLSTTIVLPVLIVAIQLVKGGEYDGDDGPRWARLLQKRMSDDERIKTAEPLIAAQLLLELPIKRSLAASRRQLESPE